MNTNTKETSLATLRNNVEQPIANLPAVTVGFDSLQGFELAQRGAKLLASSTLVPDAYRGNVANCTIALNMASRIGADPLMVMQHLYIVHGKPGWSSQFLIAAFNQCGRFTSIRYKQVGTVGSDDFGFIAWAKEKETGDLIEGPAVTIKIAKAEGWFGKSGSKWQTMPDLMLRYRAAAFFVRTVAPEIAMGLQTVDELHDVIDVEPDQNGVYVTAESLRDAQPQTAEQPQQTAEIVDDKTGEVTAAPAVEPDKPKVVKWTDNQGEIDAGNGKGKRAGKGA